MQQYFRLGIFRLVLLFSVFGIEKLQAQVIPVGLYVDLDGKVKFWLDEANRNGNVDDSVFIYYKDSKVLDDLRNVRYDLLTLIDPSRTRWTLPSNYDPSIRYDTSVKEMPSEPISHNFWETISLNSLVICDSIIFIDTTKAVVEPSPFWDDIRTKDVEDSELVEIKKILFDYIHTNYNSYGTNEVRSALHDALSEPDSIVEKVPYFNYLVDLFVKFELNKKGQPINIIGYHWDYGVEYDSINYDSMNRMIYYSRESIGSLRDEYYFNYDSLSRIASVLHYYSTVGENEESQCYNFPHMDGMKFTYSPSGKLKTRKVWNQGYPEEEEVCLEY